LQRDEEVRAVGSMIGAAVVRKEDLALLTGRGVYVDNIRLPGDMAVAFLDVVSSGYGCGRSVPRSGHVDGSPPRSATGRVWVLRRVVVR
jgi:hypothetical protein